MHYNFIKRIASIIPYIKLKYLDIHTNIDLLLHLKIVRKESANKI